MRGTTLVTLMAALAASCANDPASEQRPERAADATGSVASPYLSTQVMVRMADGQELEAVAAELGLRVVDSVGRSGYGTVAGDPAALMELLAADERIASALPVGRVLAASDDDDDDDHDNDHDHDDDDHDDDHHDDDDHDNDDDHDDDHHDHDNDDDAAREAALSWHIDRSGSPAPGTYDVRHRVVAVVGSGVAYENRNEGPGRKFKRAKSIKHSDIVAPWDFVDDDAHPNDENGHGTHVATTIAGQGDVKGVAGGVSLMPVRVLGADNTGTELHLVEGIHHAIDHGADVINLSLAFPEGYVPSRPLRQALFQAWQAGIVVVAAAGNAGENDLAWPAASPFVVAAGAGRPLSGGLTRTDYTNQSFGLDVFAPGGDLTYDDNADGYPDGVAAESFDPAAPDKLDLWLFAGTSQASAVVSGAAVHLLEAGVPAQRLPFGLQAGSRGEVTPFRAAIDAESTGVLDVGGATSLIGSGVSFPEPVSYHVAVLAYLERNDDGTITPTAQLTVLDRTGAPVSSGVRVLGTLRSNLGGQGAVTCAPTGPCGQCVVRGPAVDPLDGSGAERPLAFAFKVEAVGDAAGLRSRPRGAFFLTDELDAIVAGLRSDVTFDNAVLGFQFAEGTDPVLGNLAAGFSVTDAPSGGTTSPIGVAFNAAAADLLDVGASQVEADVGGSGIILIPVTDVVSDPFDPTGSGIPAFPSRIVAVDGSGLAGLGFTALDFLAPQGTGATCDATPVLLAEDSGLGTWPDAGTAVGAQLAAGGFVGADGQLVGSSTASVLGALPAGSPAAAEGSRTTVD